MAAVAETIKAAEATAATVKTEQDAAQAALAAVANEATAALKTHEEALKAGGQFVSFASQVAPIFAKKCVACHNAQMAKGRYNMDGFAALLKMGERGHDVVPRKPEESEVFLTIESGEMPKDADKLPPRSWRSSSSGFSTGRGWTRASRRKRRSRRSCRSCRNPPRRKAIAFPFP